MRVLILTAGSRGDVQPFVALGRGLRDAGYAVTMCTAETFRPFVTANGLHYAYMNDKLLNLKDTAEGTAALEGKGNKLALMKQAMPLMREMLHDSWQAAHGIDALIFHPKALAGSHIAEALRIPAFASIPLPMLTPTAAFPNPIVPVNLGPLANRLTYGVNRLLSAPFSGLINQWRREELGLPPRSRFADELSSIPGTHIPVLYPFSEYVVPAPADYPTDAFITGYWFLDEAWEPPASLARFLESGKAPVYIGFGSMISTDPAGKAQMVVEALKRAGQRGVLASGWGGIKPSDLPDDIYLLEQAPHDWLFPRMAAVVHHGGAGTTAAGLRAGVPSVICPFMGDQPFWGRRVYELGVGTQPIPQKRLTVDNLSAAINQAVSDNAMRQRAAELGAKIRPEDGVGKAIAIIQRSVGRAEPQAHLETAAVY